MRALSEEMDAVRRLGTKPVRLFDGELLGTPAGEWLYRFTADEDVVLADNAPARITINKTTYECTVIAVEGFHILLAIAADLGEEVPEAQLDVDLTFLIQALKQGIQPLTEPPGHAIVEQALGIREPSRRQSHAPVKWSPLRHQADENQRNAIDASVTYECSYIWGPPGTGKTWTIAAIAEAALAAGETVLITSHTNVAVDNAILNVIGAPLAEEYLRAGRIVRYGVPRLPQLHEDDRVSVRGIAAARKPELQELRRRLEAERRELRRLRRDVVRAARSPSGPPRRLTEIDRQLASLTRELAKIYEELRRLEDEILAKAAVIGTTFSKLSVSEALAERRFDLVVIDEASMAWVPQVMLAGLHALRLVIVGDFRQLPPISLSDTPLARKWLQRDVFDHAGLITRVNRGEIPSYLTPLVVQRRMHPQISRLANRLVYRGMLRDGPEAATRDAMTAHEPCPGKPVVLVDTSVSGAVSCRETSTRGGARVSRSRYNLISAALACEMARAAVVAGRQQERGRADNEPRVAVITPFSAQAKLLRRMLGDFGLNPEDAIASTVHRFQGSEADVVVFDCADGPPRRPAVLVRGGFGSAAMRLVNVAVTRARGKLIVVGDARYLCERLDPGDTLRCLIEEIRECGTVCPGAAQQGSPGSLSPSAPGLYRDADPLSSLKERLESASNVDVLAGRNGDQLLGLRLRVPPGARVRWFVAPRWRRPELPAAGEICRLKWHPVASVIVVDEKTAFIQSLGGRGCPVPDIYRLEASDALRWFISMLERSVSTGSEEKPRGNALGARCPDHGLPLVVRRTRSGGLFLGCPKYRSTGCTKRSSLRPDDLNVLLRNRLCGNGHRGVVVRRGPYGWFAGCAQWPSCGWNAGVQYLAEVLSGRATGGSCAGEVDRESEDEDT